MFFAASTVIGGAYYVVPRILEGELYSRRLARAQYAFFVIGFAFFFIGFVLAGLLQGSNWVHQGLPVWSVLPGLRPYMALRIMGGTLLVTSFMMFACNIIATITARRPLRATGDDAGTDGPQRRPLRPRMAEEG